MDPVVDRYESTEYHEYMQYFVDAFLALHPEQAQHFVPGPTAPHQERTVLAHTILALQVLHRTDRYLQATIDDQFIMDLTVLLHDVGKCIIWHRLVTSNAVLDGTQPWGFRGRDVVGASWFLNHVITQGWSRLQFNPVYYGIWFSLVSHPDNQPLLNFLPSELFEIINFVDDYGTLENISSLPANPVVPVFNPQTKLPAGPLVIYILGVSGSGKTYLARQLYQQLTRLNISCDYISFDRTMLRNAGYCNMWDDLNPAIRGANIKDTTSIYHDCYTRHRKQPNIVSNMLAAEMKSALQRVQVVIFTCTVLKPTYRKLPFYSSQFTSIVTTPDRLLNDTNTAVSYFSAYDTTMSANCRFAGFANPGPLLYVPPELVIPAVRNLLSIPKFVNAPPPVSQPLDLVPLALYLYLITGTLEGVKAAFSHYYGVTPKTYECRNGWYLNLSYQADASYDDSYNPGWQSPAIYCRGTTLYFDGTGFEMARLPMNRGKEVTSIDNVISADDSDLEDGGNCSLLYSKILGAVNVEESVYSAKIDGTLVLVYIDTKGLVDGVNNEFNVCFGTAGKLLMSQSNEELMVMALNRMGHSINSFAGVCRKYMEEVGATTLAFEMVGGARPKVVVQYEEEFWGMYFLGCTVDQVFRPYYMVEHEFKCPETKTLALNQNKTLGMFGMHFEGAVLWTRWEGQYYPLKLKTTLYYWLHKTRYRPEYSTYIMALIAEYGWILESVPTKEQLDRVKPGPYIMALIALPEWAIIGSKLLKEAREQMLYLYLLGIEEKQQMGSIKTMVDGKTYTRVRRFMSVYLDGKYERIYNWVV